MAEAKPSSEDPTVVSPYLQRPLRTLEQALKDCGRARDETAVIVPLPFGRRARPDERHPDGEEADAAIAPPERLGASA